jgi:hypothetical protein
MPKIKQKKGKRFRIQISMEEDLWQEYDENCRIAQERGAEIDFSEDFDRWFRKINEQIRQMLTEKNTTSHATTSPAPAQVKGGGDNA